MNVDKAIKKFFRGGLEWGIQPDARVVDERVDGLVSESTELAAQRGGKGVSKIMNPGWGRLRPRTSWQSLEG